MNSRARCTNCRSYFKPDKFYMDNQMTRVCSEECYHELRASRSLKGRRTVVRSRRGRVSSSSSSPSQRSNGRQIPSEVRRRVLDRDGRRCRFCNTKENLHLHHIVYRSQGGPDEDWNLITLCLEHHDKVHSSKRTWMPVLRAYIWVRYTEGEVTTIPVLARVLDRLGLLSR